MGRLLGFFAAPMLIGFVLASQALAAPLRVVASFSILGDLVRQVGNLHAAGGGEGGEGGEGLSVVTLVGPNGDAHVFEPSPADARAVRGAALVVINGFGLEGWMLRLFQSTGYRGPVVVASAGVAPRTGSADGHSGLDPHAWQNVVNVKVYVRNIVEGLVKVDPGHAAAYRANGTAYEAKLDTLDGEVRAAFARLSPGRREVITSHDALGYFGDAYGLTLLAPEGFSTDSEPSAKGVAALIDQIRRMRSRAVFVENMSDPRLIRQIAKETGTKLGGQLFSDSLSPVNGPAATYLDMIRHNTRLIVDALSGPQ
ncbi:MAG: metal ABC transporter substrate-binding protein [Rhodospirillaceae bacterium]